MRNMQQASQMLFPISEKDAALERLPYILPFEPPAAIAALATGQVNQIVSWQDFVATHLGFTSPTVGFPAAPGRWLVQIQDIGSSKVFQPQGFDITALTGANTGTSDSPAFELPVPWVFLEKTTVRITFTERTGFPNTPHLLLIGYLTNWAREASAAQALQELNLRILRRQAGDAF